MNSVAQDMVDGGFYVGGHGCHRSLNVKTINEANAILCCVNEWGWSAYNDGSTTWKLYL